MPGYVSILWDYDSAIGRIHSLYPYNFIQERLFEEIENVDFILQVAAEHAIVMTFACVGFAAEPGPRPYHIPDQIKRIHDLGHEVASHSWRHEWFPFLEKEQIRRSLLQSKQTLENCIGVKGCVTGFVPPFNRPASWYAKGSFSLGDRKFGPWNPGSNIGSLLKLIKEAGYSWCRFTYISLLNRLRYKFSRHGFNPPGWVQAEGLTVMPHHCVGFDENALVLLERASLLSDPAIISAHPAALDLGRRESRAHFLHFIERLADYQAKGKLKTLSISGGMRLKEAGHG